jgi:hypothetical protein
MSPSSGYAELSKLRRVSFLNFGKYLALLTDIILYLTGLETSLILSCHFASDCYCLPMFSIQSTFSSPHIIPRQISFTFGNTAVNTQRTYLLSEAGPVFMRFIFRYFIIISKFKKRQNFLTNLETIRFSRTAFPCVL